MSRYPKKSVLDRKIEFSVENYVPIEDPRVFCYCNSKKDDRCDYCIEADMMLDFPEPDKYLNAILG